MGLSTAHVPRKELKCNFEGRLARLMSPELGDMRDRERVGHWPK